MFSVGKSVVVTTNKLSPTKLITHGRRGELEYNVMSHVWLVRFNDGVTPSTATIHERNLKLVQIPEQSAINAHLFTPVHSNNANRRDCYVMVQTDDIRIKSRGYIGRITWSGWGMATVKLTTPLPSGQQTVYIGLDKLVFVSDEYAEKRIQNTPGHIASGPKQLYAVVRDAKLLSPVFTCLAHNTDDAICQFNKATTTDSPHEYSLVAPDGRFYQIIRKQQTTYSIAP